MKVGGGNVFRIVRRGKGKKISGISIGDKRVEGYFLADRDLKSGKKMIITTR